jgi:hypothetical protein
MLSPKRIVYSDYLSDNYYLIHPSMAGAACKKRLTANNGLVKGRTGTSNNQF